MSGIPASAIHPVSAALLELLTNPCISFQLDLSAAPLPANTMASLTVVPSIVDEQRLALANRLTGEGEGRGC